MCCFWVETRKFFGGVVSNRCFDMLPPSFINPSPVICFPSVAWLCLLPRVSVLLVVVFSPGVAFFFFCRSAWYVALNLKELSFAFSYFLSCFLLFFRSLLCFFVQYVDPFSFLPSPLSFVFLLSFQALLVCRSTYYREYFVYLLSHISSPPVSSFSRTFSTLCPRARIYRENKCALIRARLSEGHETLFFRNQFASGSPGKTGFGVWRGLLALVVYKFFQFATKQQPFEWWFISVCCWRQDTLFRFVCCCCQYAVAFCAISGSGHSLFSCAVGVSLQFLAV